MKIKNHKATVHIILDFNSHYAETVYGLSHSPFTLYLSTTVYFLTPPQSIPKANMKIRKIIILNIRNKMILIRYPAALLFIIMSDNLICSGDLSVS